MRRPFDRRFHVPQLASLLAVIAMLLAGGAADAQLDAAAAASARSGGAESPPAEPDLHRAAAGLAVADRVVNLQIVGRLGTDVSAAGFEVLAQHRHRFRSAAVVVVEIESDGGSDATGLRLARALAMIAEEAPVVMIVRRAIGPAAMLLPVADRIFVPEPSSPGVIIALQPECGRLEPIDPEATVQRFGESMHSIVEQSPRRELWTQVLADPRLWHLTARDAYGAGIAEPIDGGPTALGRTLRIDPWIPSGKQVDEVVRRATLFEQQVQLYRSRLAARAFASLSAVNEILGQVALAEQTAASLDPRRSSDAPSLRLEPRRGEWTYSAASRTGWNKACDAAAAAWERVALLSESAGRSLRSVTVDIGMLVDAARLEPSDPLLPEMIDRLEFERSELEPRIAALGARGRAAREESRALLALRR